MAKVDRGPPCRWVGIRLASSAGSLIPLSRLFYLCPPRPRCARLGFVQAMNMYDLDGMASRFAPDAMQTIRCATTRGVR